MKGLPEAESLLLDFVVRSDASFSTYAFSSPIAPADTDGTLTVALHCVLLPLT